MVHCKSEHKRSHGNISDKQSTQNLHDISSLPCVEKGISSKIAYVLVGN